MEREVVFVRKNIKTLNKIGYTIAKDLKRGESVEFQYGEKEVEVVKRFEQRLGKLYDEVGIEYPPKGYIVYRPDCVEVSENPHQSVRPSCRYILVFDDIECKVNRVKSFITSSIKTIKDKYESREKW